MTSVLRVLSAAGQALAFTCALAPIGLPSSALAQSPASPTAAKSQGATRVNADAAAQADFQQRLQKYIALRQQLASKLKPLSPTANAADLAARQESLAVALRTARKDARQGDLITPAIAEQIRRAVVADFKQRPPAAKRAVFEEVPERIQPAINKTLVDSAALATIPPLLLNNLPRLPDNLQYRFIGRHIVLLDGDTRLMIDYMLNILPAH